MKKNIFALLLVFAMIIMSFAGCQQSSPGQADSDEQGSSGDEIVIGIYLPMTGSNAAGGEMSMEGINLAHDQYPEVLGRPIRMVLVDDKSDKVEASNAVTRLIEKEKVCSIIGSYSSSLAIPGSEVAQAAGIPMVANTATNPLVTQGKDYIFRSCFIDPLQGTALAQFAVNELGAKTAMIILDTANDYSVGVANYFQKAFEEAAGTAVSDVRYKGGDQEFTAQLSEVKTVQPDILFIPAGNYGDAGLIAKQARDLGVTATFIGPDTWDTPEFAEIGGAAIDGSYFSTHFDPERTSDSATAYCAAFEDKYGKPSSSAAALSYDAYMLLYDAIDRAGSDDPTAIRDALVSVVDFRGVTGTINFDADHNPIKDVIIEEITDGHFQFVKAVTPE